MFRQNMFDQTQPVTVEEKELMTRHDDQVFLDGKCTLI